MTNTELQTLISSWNPELTFSEAESQFLNITVQPEHLHRLAIQLKSTPETAFDYLFCLTGMDWGMELGVLYHLESTIHRHKIVLRVYTADRDNPAFDSVSDVWRTAEFHEREVYDFFGIKFNNHPLLKRLFMPLDWPGYPLRKDYTDEINMVVK